MSDCRTLMSWDPRYLDYDFGEGHPFSERSRGSAVRLLEAMRFFERTNISRQSEVSQIPDHMMLNFHTLRHVERVRRESESPEPGLLDHGDTPAFSGVWDASRRVVSGTVHAVQSVVAGEFPHATNLAGGLHHASPGAASGFCVLNDVGVAIATGLKKDWFQRIAYIDIDAHHGDGVMYGFYGDGRVLDIDFHQDGRTLFPGTGSLGEVGAEKGKGLKVNVPLPPGTGTEDFLFLFERIVPGLLRDYRPELIVMQSGVDAFSGDPLAHLEYTRRAYSGAVTLVHELAHELCHGRMVLVGGGGYSPASVARVLAQDALILSGDGVPQDDDPLPDTWRAEFTKEFSEAAPTTWGSGPHDAPRAWPAGAREKLLHQLSEHTGHPMGTGH